MNGALAEGGALGLAWLLLWSAVPLWFVFKLAKDWRGTLRQLRRDPLGFVAMTFMLAGMIGWFGWLVSDGILFSGGWSAIICIAGLILFYTLPKRRS